MKKIIVALLLMIPILAFSQETDKYSIVKTQTTNVRIPGKWTQLNTMDDSGQTYLQNEDEVIIAIAQNPKKAYSFYKSKNSDFKNVQEFYKWDSDYRRELKFKTDEIQKNKKLEYIIWKFNDGKLDNVFLFGSVKDNFINLLVYTNKWSEIEKVKFLKNLYKLNK
ncbi:hypothetical protein [Polaribacter sp. SA4-12]|uniref:hypothetical protein n=1 Tax=Polaribacter sp. SA4-12 TaxID=1312072 RepID=UPI000B3C393C|nr:hypothetical protein [Polaribacter sp. SA4-12]ARV14381.1 hypothetical protein BTO07_04105 [Polaribacter sp. SA4-12]